MRASSWALELADLGRRIAALEGALAGEDVLAGLDPWEPPAALDTPPTPKERQLFEALMARLEACQTGVEQAARDFASRVAEDQQRRAAARRYARP
ncbi:MAG TPA: hypothetical protein VII47_07620 [Actinomycetota bacterium]